MLLCRLDGMPINDSLATALSVGDKILSSGTGPLDADEIATLEQLGFLPSRSNLEYRSLMELNYALLSTIPDDKLPGEEPVLPSDGSYEPHLPNSGSPPFHRLGRQA